MLRKYAGVILGLALSVIMVSTVLAEGSFNSYIYGAANGFTSRTWVDRNLDNVSTSVNFNYCSDSIANGTSDWADVRVQRYNWAFPATNLGTLRLYCYYYGATGYWGDVPAADYAFVVHRYGPATCSGAYPCPHGDFRFNVQDLWVRY